jgi:hypothetical protein
MAFDLSEDACQVADAISAFPVPDVGQTLLSLIEMFIQFGDEESMTPKIQSGGRDSDQTAYEASIRVEKAGKYCKALDLDPDQWLKSVQQLQQEAQAQQNVAAVLARQEMLCPASELPMRPPTSLRR